jgi:hypothetical protein
MIGCSPNHDTSAPFHIPHSVATPSAHGSTMISGYWVTSAMPVPPLSTSSPPIIAAATAPEIATTTPTEMSMPRVATTRVRPIAMIISGEPRLRISIRLP